MERDEAGREGGFSALMENLRWLQRNYARLRKKYGNKWILIHDKKVVKAEDTFEDILPFTKKYEQSSVLLEYMRSDEIAMFF